MKEIAFINDFELLDLVMVDGKTVTRRIADSDDPLYEVGEIVKIKGTDSHIEITDIRSEKLRDITEEDCLKEGIVMCKYMDASHEWNKYYFYVCVSDKNCPYGQYMEYATAQEAFASLINEIYGRDVWKENPEVWRIEFERVK